MGKMILCGLLIFFVATMSGCSGGAIKSAVKGAANTGKKVVKVAGKHADDVLDVAEVAGDLAGSNSPDGRNGARGVNPKPSSAAKAGMMMAGGAMVANEFLSNDRHWIQDMDSGAYLWNPEPQDGESVRWSGGVVREGDTLYAQGPGTLTWYKNGQVIQRDEGAFEHGRHHGHFSHTFPSGRVDYSNWDHGVEIPESALVTSGIDDARQAFINYHRAITNHDYRAAYETLSYAQRQRVGEFGSYVNGFTNTISSEVTELNLISSDVNSYTFDYTLRARDRASGGVMVRIFRGEVTMAMDGGRWYVRYAKSSKVSERYE